MAGSTKAADNCSHGAAASSSAACNSRRRSCSRRVLGTFSGLTFLHDVTTGSVFLQIPGAKAVRMPKDFLAKADGEVVEEENSMIPADDTKSAVETGQRAKEPKRVSLLAMGRQRREKELMAPEGKKQSSEQDGEASSAASKGCSKEDRKRLAGITAEFLSKLVFTESEDQPKSLNEIFGEQISKELETGAADLEPGVQNAKAEKEAAAEEVTKTKNKEKENLALIANKPESKLAFEAYLAASTARDNAQARLQDATTAWKNAAKAKKEELGLQKLTEINILKFFAENKERFSLFVNTVFNLDLGFKDGWTWENKRDMGSLFAGYVHHITTQDPNMDKDSACFEWK
ncbi:unnamed protein product, partial [Amoebophrya sp. A120]|eukprot:GSA120T00023891001.1